MLDLPPKVVAAIDECSKQWGARNVARQHLEAIARLAIEEALCEFQLPNAIWLAKFFHDTYERLAPQYGYETRRDTRQFDHESPNGRLMAAVCEELRAACKPQSEREG